MNRRILLAILLVLPFGLYSQTYNFNRQTIITFVNERSSKIDAWTTPITVEVNKTYIVLSRPANGAGEKIAHDTLVIKNTGKEFRDGYNDFTKLKIVDGRTMIIYGDEYITMCTRETKDHRRIEYVFYNQKP